MFDALEECLNYPSHYGKPGWEAVQLDLLIPVKEK